MKIAYLVQGRAAELSRWDEEVPRDAYLCTLSWDEERLGSGRNRGERIFLPNSTWAEGRNLQLEVARASSDFDYYFFLDADARFEDGADGLLAFQDSVLALHPSIAVPLTDVIRESGRYDPKLRVQKPIGFDQVVQAYSRKCVEEGITLPLVTAFDEKSWWYACEINQYLCLRYYPEEIVQFNDVLVHNDHQFNEVEAGFKYPRQSRYRSGIDESGMQEARKFVLQRFGDQPLDVGTFFQPRRRTGGDSYLRSRTGCRADPDEIDRHRQLC